MTEEDYREYFRENGPWIPRLVDIQYRHDHNEPGYENVGFSCLDVPASLANVTARLPELNQRFLERYASRMINSETVERWQVRLQNRFDEVADRYERAYELYARYETQMLDDMLEGWERDLVRDEDTSGTDTSTRTGSEDLERKGKETDTRSGSESDTPIGTEKIVKSGSETDTPTGTQKTVKSGNTELEKLGSEATEFLGSEKVTDGMSDTVEKRIINTPDSAINASDNYADALEKGKTTYGKTQTRDFTQRKDELSFTGRKDKETFNNVTEEQSFTDRSDEHAYNDVTEERSFENREDKHIYNNVKDERSFTGRIDTRTYNQIKDALLHGKQIDIHDVEKYHVTGAQIVENINRSIRAWQDLDTQFVAEFENLFLNIFWC